MKSGEDEDPIGVASVLNLHRYRDLDCLQQIAAYLTEHCSDTKLKQLTAVGTQTVGGARYIRMYENIAVSSEAP